MLVGSYISFDRLTDSQMLSAPSQSSDYFLRMKLPLRASEDIGAVDGQCLSYNFFGKRNSRI